MSGKRGPFVNEWDDEMYYPVRDWPYNDARSDVASHVEGTHGPWARTKYEGKLNTVLHDHDEPWSGEIDPDYCVETCTDEPCWTFTTYEGTYRR